MFVYLVHGLTQLPCHLQVAQALAPSIVYIDELEKVLNTDKKLVKQWKAAGMCVWPRGSLLLDQHRLTQSVACAYTFRYPYEDKPDRIKAMLIACMKELEKDHSDMLAAYESGDKERVEEADQTNNRVSQGAGDAFPRWLQPRQHT